MQRQLVPLDDCYICAGLQQRQALRSASSGLDKVAWIRMRRRGRVVQEERGETLHTLQRRVEALALQREGARVVVSRAVYQQQRLLDLVRLQEHQ